MGRKIKIMGILNVTPDSFSDGGKFASVDLALAQAVKMAEDGADIIDVGGESTGPGSRDVSEQEELRRVVPVIESLRDSTDGVIANAVKQSKIDRRARLRSLAMTVSIDTYKSAVAEAAIKAGATIVNDVTALRGDPKMAELIAKTGAMVVLMYSKDKTARTTREPKKYKDVVKTVKSFLKKRIAFALSRGIKKSQIIIDPGMGAFVSGEPKYSFEILERLGEFRSLGCPILVGVSRKSFLGGKIGERDLKSAMASALAAKNGADIIRVHAPAEHRVFLQAFEETFL